MGFVPHPNSWFRPHPDCWKDRQKGSRPIRVAALVSLGSGDFASTAAPSTSHLFTL